MEISLRKASALQRSLNEAVKGIKFEASVAINEFQNPEVEITRANHAMCDSLMRRDSLSAVITEIRKKVGDANNSAGIDNRLAEIAALEKDIQFYTPYANIDAREDQIVINGKLDKIRNRKEDARSLYARDDVVTTTVFDQGSIAAFKARVSTAKKSKQKLQDELLELNISTKVTLSAGAVATLETEGLL